MNPENNQINPEISGLTVQYPLIARVFEKEGEVSVIFHTGDNGRVLKWEIEHSTDKIWEKAISKSIASCPELKIIGLEPGSTAKQSFKFKIKDYNSGKKNKSLIIVICVIIIAAVLLWFKWLACFLVLGGGICNHFAKKRRDRYKGPVFNALGYVSYVGLRILGFILTVLGGLALFAK